MSHPTIQQVEKEEAAGKKLPDFRVGDTVDVHVRIVEGENERVQVFRGTVLICFLKPVRYHFRYT